MSSPETQEIAPAEHVMAMDPEQIRALGYRIVDLITEELGAPDRRPIYPPPHRWDELDRRLGGELPEQGSDPFAVIETIRRDLIPASANYIHPRLLGYVSSTPLPLTGLIEALVASVRLFPYTWSLTPGSCLIEAVVARWLGQMVGFSDQAAGYMTTGGSWANLMGLAVARLRRCGWDVKEEGLGGHPALCAYTSNQAHSCHEQSMRLLGMGAAQLRQIAVDDDYRIDLAALEAAIQTDLAAGLKPFCLLANAGTTNTGAIDPLEAMADLAEHHGLWFHVDGAYGAFAALDPQVRPQLAGLSRADSAVVDPHKWLNMPYDAGCVLTRKWSDLSDTFALIPTYLEAGHAEEAHDHWKHGFELTRTDRALKVWVALKQYGLESFRAMVSQHIALARRLGEWVDAADDFELITRPALSVCCFRYRPRVIPGDAAQTEPELDRLNLALENALARDGRALVTGTELNGRRVLRCCIVNHRATWEGIEYTLALIRELGQKLTR